jgi:hypothetical protein
MRRPVRIQEDVAVPEIIRVRCRLGVEEHYGPALGGRIHRPFRQAGTVRIAGARKVRPVLLHQLAQLAILRPPGNASPRILRPTVRLAGATTDAQIPYADSPPVPALWPHEVWL